MVRNYWTGHKQQPGQTFISTPCSCCPPAGVAGRRTPAAGRPFPAVDSNDPGTAGFSGSLIVAEFSTLAAATEWAQADPYVSAGVFARVEVKPFKKTFPA